MFYKMEKQQPLVSVITITRNRGHLLKRCIKSVLSQTYINIEHIVVDGASTDDTNKIVSQFNDNRLKFYQLESNWPIVSTINYGISMSKGEFVTFLDSDDEYLPQKIEKQVKLLESLPEEYGMVYCWMTYFDSKTNKVKRIHKPEYRGDVSTIAIQRPIISGTPTFMFRRNAFVENGGWKDDIGIISDWEMASRFCQSWKIDYLPESLVNVYVNHGYLRQSDKSYYHDLALRRILFHNYFLERYSNLFQNNLRSTKYHYENLCEAYFCIGKYKKGVNMYIKMLGGYPSISQIIKPLIIFINSLWK